MIKVKVTKNIIRKGNVAFGLDTKQVIIGFTAVCIGGLLFFLLRNIVSTDLLMTIIFVTMAVIIFCGVIQINGVSFISFLMKGIQGVDKRPFDRKGVYNNDEFSDSIEKE
ncbi:MAG: PrgI family protein [Oscillospiraceae bacterium]|nr:PrgI family protein [Oscillospiraceae bacterium]